MDWAPYTLDSTPLFCLDGLTARARVLDCHDGDSLKVALPIDWAGGCVRLVPIRLLGVDTPEMSIATEKSRAVRARDALLHALAPDVFDGIMSHSPSEVRQLLSSHVVTTWVTCSHADKYGRCLAVLHSETANLNALMQSYGDAYYGERKTRSWAAEQ